MRIIFCGSGEFAVPTLLAVLAAGHEVVKVVTQPARPSGRGGKVHHTPVSEAARQAKLDILECPNINAPDAVEALRTANGDLICVVDFGQMVRAAARGAARLGAFNLHGSLLPELRGAAPVNWAVIRGCSHTGVTTFSLVDKMDAGAMFLQDATDISPEETAEELRRRLADIGAGTVCRTLEMLASGAVRGQVQNESRATLAPRLTKSDGIIDWSADAITIRNLVHGVWPWPGGQAVFISGKNPGVPVAIARVQALGDDHDATGVPREPGVLGVTCGATGKKELTVAAGRGRLRIVEIQPAGKKLMPWQAFVNGHRPQQGDRFARPSS